MTEIEQILNLRFHEKSCANCKFLRYHTTGASVSECLLLGRTMGITRIGHYSQLMSWAREKVCDGWGKRPKGWDVHAERNPHWYDEYYPREQLLKMRSRILKRRRK